MKKSFFLLFLAVSSFTYAQRDYTFIYNNDSIINAGTKLHDAGKYNDAIKEYEKIATSDPQYPRAQYEKALSIYSLENDDNTRAFIQECFDKKLMREEPALYSLYGSFLSDKKEYDASEKIFAEALAFMPKNANLIYNYGLLKLRKGERQACVDLLEKSIALNPAQYSAHYFLGLMAFESGHVTEGSLALLSYLVSNANGRYAEKAIEMLNVKMGENYLTKDDLKYNPAGGDNFADIEEVLRNQLPLKKAYKVNSDFDDDPIMRQLQAICEYSLEHKSGNGFFENTYLPWIRQLMADKQFENMSYFILLSKEDKLGKTLTSHKKDILAFDAYINKDFWNYFALRNVEHFGKTQPIVISVKSNQPYAAGALKNGKKDGKYKLMNEYGFVTAELNFKDDALDGKQVYYYQDGKLKTENEYTAGKQNGIKKDYYTNGQLSLMQQFVNDKLSGVSSSYYVNGGKNCEVNFTDDERDGKLVCIYQNGAPKTEENYVKGKLEGLHTSYNEQGDVTEKYMAKNNEIDGNYVTYYDGKIVREEAQYQNGKINGKLKRYFANSALDEERDYVNGNLKLSLSYLANGRLSSESHYDDKGKLESYFYFDDAGKKYYEEKYRGGELKSSWQYSADKPKPTEISLSKKPFQINSLSGNPIAKGEYASGNKVKEWSYFYASGLVRSKENYEAGTLQGLGSDYNNNGTLSKIRNYRDGKLSGLYEEYDYGVLSAVYHFSDDSKNGPYTTFDAGGIKDSEGYYEDDQNNYTKTYYRIDGSPSDRIKYIDGVETAYEFLDLKGKVDRSIDYKGKTEKLTFMKDSGLISVSMDLVNGEINGKNIKKDKFGTPLLEEEYVNGQNINRYRYFTPAGTVQVDRNYYCGKVHGKETWYDYAGSLRLEENYLFGNEYGKSQTFYQNKQPMIDRNYIDGGLEGDVIYYNLKGEPILKLGYVNNVLRYYIKLGKTGLLDDKIETTNENADILSSYSNGKPAIKMQFVKGSLDGKFQIASAEGKTIYEINYDKNLINGERVEYYASGKLYKKERFQNGDLNGAQEYFTEEGKPIIVLNYKNNRLHGDTVIYGKTGKTTKKYNSNELVEIIR